MGVKVGLKMWALLRGLECEELEEGGGCVLGAPPKAGVNLHLQGGAPASTH